MTIVLVLYLLFLSFITLNVLYWVVFAVAGWLGKADDRKLAPGETLRYRKIGVLIPAYKEDAVIVESVTANLRQDYPADRYDLIVIADSFQPQTLATLAEMPIKVLEVTFEVSTVAKAINAALDRLPIEEYEILVVSDADNLMAVDFLSRINIAFSQGWKAVQGHRVAKNVNTSVAILDAASEEINNHIFRKGARALGLSSSIIGSGMAFDPMIMKACMAAQHTMGGYDKELETNLVLNGTKIAYLADAYIYDEKVAHRDVFQHQRTRWVAAQWQFVKFYFLKGVNELLHGRFASGIKVIQGVVLPKILLLGLVALGVGVGLVVGRPLLWEIPFVMLLILSASIVLAFPAYLWKRVRLKELLLIPVLLWSFVRAVLNMRKAFKRFMHTPHNSSPDTPAPNA